MSLCSEVNLNLLNKCFDLGPLHGLKKPHPDDDLHPPATPASGMQSKAQAKCYTHTKDADTNYTTMSIML